ncbi:MAG: hypothetical protein JRM94_02385 [Nitrososphaerota archaeon]|jgi:hypothetical protein|nr:hypothetical protein [Nitrososphaerota archaeon]
MGTTSSYILDLSGFPIKHPQNRTHEEAPRIKELIDVTYNKPEISIDDLMQARRHMVYIIDVDSGIVRNILRDIQQGGADCPGLSSDRPTLKSTLKRNTAWVQFRERVQTDRTQI